MGEGLVVIESLEERGRGRCVVMCCVMVIAALYRNCRGLRLEVGSEELSVRAFVHKNSHSMAGVDVGTPPILMGKISSLGR